MGDGISPPALPQINPAQPAEEINPPAAKPADPIKDAAPLEEAPLDVERRGKNVLIIPRSSRKTTRPFIPGSITYISSMVVDLDANRVALLSPQGPPMMGDISTDLKPGVYHVAVDRQKNEWIFDSGEVKSGMRFAMAVDGPDPFIFDYPEKVVLLVQHGFARSGPNSLGSKKKVISEAVQNDDIEAAFVELLVLNDVDMYDVLGELWLEDTATPMKLIVHFHRAAELDRYDQDRLLRALESFQEKREALYIDSFDKCFVHPSSFEKPLTKEGKARETRGLWNIKLVFIYDKGINTTRAIMMYADDILSDTKKPTELPQYGEGGLLYPRYCSAGTCPRMYAAKLEKIKEIKTNLFLPTVEAGLQAVLVVMDITHMAAGMTLRTNMLRGPSRSVRQTKPVTAAGEDPMPGPKVPAEEPTPAPKVDAPAASESAASKEFTQMKQQTGEWHDDFAVGRNQRPVDSKYVTKVAKVPDGKPDQHYFMNGKQFDAAETAGRATLPGERPDVLVECKNWRRGGIYWKIITGKLQQPKMLQRLTEKILEAEDIVKKADGIPVEFRVNDAEVAMELQKIFKTWEIDAKVVFAPAKL